MHTNRNNRKRGVFICDRPWLHISRTALCSKMLQFKEAWCKIIMAMQIPCMQLAKTDLSDMPRVKACLCQTFIQLPQNLHTRHTLNLSLKTLKHNYNHGSGSLQNARRRSRGVAFTVRVMSGDVDMAVSNLEQVTYNSRVLSLLSCTHLSSDTAEEWARCQCSFDTSTN